MWSPRWVPEPGSHSQCQRAVALTVPSADLVSPGGWNLGPGEARSSSMMELKESNSLSHPPLTESSPSPLPGWKAVSGSSQGDASLQVGVWPVVIHDGLGSHSHALSRWGGNQVSRAIKGSVPSPTLLSSMICTCRTCWFGFGFFFFNNFWLEIYLLFVIHFQWQNEKGQNYEGREILEEMKSDIQFPPSTSSPVFTRIEFYEILKLLQTNKKTFQNISGNKLSSFLQKYLRTLWSTFYLCQRRAQNGSCCT